MEAVVGKDLLLAPFAAPDERRLVLPGAGGMPVQAVVGDVEFSVDEPSRVRVVPLPDPVPRLEPDQFTGDPVPEGFRVAHELLVGPGVIRCPGCRLAPGVGGVAFLLQFHGECLLHTSSIYMIHHTRLPRPVPVWASVPCKSG
ncbi:hypothetical protein DSECCO2_573080 [anaerobic digester metagenome]